MWNVTTVTRRVIIPVHVHIPDQPQQINRTVEDHRGGVVGGVVDEDEDVVAVPADYPALQC